MVVQELFPVPSVQQDPEPRLLRLAPGRHLLQAPPQGALYAQGRGEGLNGGDNQKEEKRGLLSL